MICDYTSEQFEKIIWNDFIQRMKNEKSIATYETDVVEFIELIKKDFLNLSAADVEVYYKYLSAKVNDRKIQINTMGKKFRELHSLAKFIDDNRDEYDVPNTFDDFFYPYSLRIAKADMWAKTIPAEHIDKLLVTSKDDLMFFCMLALLFRVGLSSVELIELRAEDFAEYDNGLFVFVKAREESCYVPDDAAEIVKDYLIRRKPDTYLFCNTRGNKLNVMYVSRLMKKYCNKAGIPEYSAQALRGACGSIMFSYGTAPAQVARQMGITTKQIRRYNNITYKDELLSNVGKLVKIKVELPD